MDDPGIAEHVASLPLTTLALFSVTHTGKGAINTNARGHPWITGDVGRGMIAAAHQRGTRVELVYSSFGAGRNKRLLQNADLQATVIAGLVATVRDLGLDGINVDIEALDPLLVPAYGTFVASLRAAAVAAQPDFQVSVATGAHALGAAMAVAAAGAGADRIFMMGYDYRTGRSQPGASAPLDHSDGEPQSLRASLDLYGLLGVPPERLLLGLPLSGVDWPVAGPAIGAPSTGRGEAWFPRAHVDLLTDPAVVPERDEVEQVDVYFSSSDGLSGPPASSPAAVESFPIERAWRAVYVDTPQTLTPKLALADEQGLAGAGFWAVGYTRGLPAYTDLMTAFTTGAPLP
jgi:spore germination protein YaaH